MHRDVKFDLFFPPNTSTSNFTYEAVETNAKPKIDANLNK
jgi:hypothetical protein